MSEKTQSARLAWEPWDKHKNTISPFDHPVTHHLGCSNFLNFNNRTATFFVSVLSFPLYPRYNTHWFVIPCLFLHGKIDLSDS